MTIIGGMYGKHSKQINLAPETYKKHCGRKAYYTAFSKYGILTDEFSETFVCPDERVARIITQNSGRIITQTDNDEYYMLVSKPKKLRQKTRAHIYAFVL